MIASQGPDKVRDEEEVDYIGLPIRDSSGRTSHIPTAFSIVPDEIPSGQRHEANAPYTDQNAESTAAQDFRSTRPAAAAQAQHNAASHKDEASLCIMHKFSLYETASRFFLVGADITDHHFKILKIDRKDDCQALCIQEDATVYTKTGMNHLLNIIDDSNKASGGLRFRCSTWGLLGFIRFTKSYHILLITKRSQVAVIGGHYIYQVDGTDLIPLASQTSSRSKNFDIEEARFVSILNNLDLSRSFYFSYCYDITTTLQKNIMREHQGRGRSYAKNTTVAHDTMFVWNHFLLEPAHLALKDTYSWCLAVVHGFVDQATISIYGRPIHITIIARRSRHFAGARFLKRGANDLGFVANDVETEQIVSDMLTTSFHAPGGASFANPGYTSYVQHRGSIPLYWSQDSTGVSPKPDIELNLVDPFYTAAALHFDNLFERYGAPVYVLNLIKARERLPRESILLREYSNAISYLNQSLPADKKIQYNAWDMSRASKSHDQDVIGTLESIAEEVMSLTGLFHNGTDTSELAKMQNGVARTNCIDCLDRTNAAQFVIGKRALGHQLHALGVINDTAIDYDTDAVNLFTHMYHDHGDTIAIQYGGSHLVNTMETYRKVNQWSSHSRDMVESFKRYYNNSFLDKQRQEAYNLFLGNYTFALGQPMLWDLSTDYYLHHADPRVWSAGRQKHYIQWFSAEHLGKRRMPMSPRPHKPLHRKPFTCLDDYWLEYYRPLALSSFSKLFAYKMNSTLKYIPFKATRDGRYDLSPFCVRDGHENTSAESRYSKKQGTLTTGQGAFPMTPAVGPSHSSIRPEHSAKRFFLHNERDSKPHDVPENTYSVSSEQHQYFPGFPRDQNGVKDRQAITQLTLDQIVSNSLEPSVTTDEAHEYERYITHPLHLALVVSIDAAHKSDGRISSYICSIPAEIFNTESTQSDLQDYQDFLDVGEEPLKVNDADTAKKRYKAYRQWVKGKSLFKQRTDT